MSRESNEKGRRPSPGRQIMIRGSTTYTILWAMSRDKLSDAIPHATRWEGAYV